MKSLTLESYLCSRMDPSILSRISWEERFRSLPPFASNFLAGKLWKWPLRHMRNFPASVTFELTGPSSWRIYRKRHHIATSTSLLEWVGMIDRPLTIVASGPSAMDCNLDELRHGGRMIVAVNGSPTFLAERGIRPDAWVISDSNFVSSIERHLENASGVPLATTFRAAALIAERFPDQLSNRPLCLIERVNQCYGVRSLRRDSLLELNERSGSPFIFPAGGCGKSVTGWSHRPELGFFSGCTVTFAALQLVIRLGARDIEIIGMDLTNQGRSYQEGDKARPSSLVKVYERAILPSFEIMHESLKGTGVTIKNQSPVCPLPSRIFAS